MTLMFDKNHDFTNLSHKDKDGGTEVKIEKPVHIIGFSSTKGGSGKSTCACTIGASLSIRGYRVLIIDMDAPQYTTYTFFNNRKKFIKNDVMLVRNIYFDISHLGYYNEYETYKKELLELLERENIQDYDFVLLDSGGYYNHLTQLVIELSHILITPINLSAIDFNVLFNYDNVTDEISEGQYTKFLKESKNKYRKIKWYVIPNRCHQIITEYQKKCLNILQAVGDLIGYNVTSNIMDRILYSQGFDYGITCFDSMQNNNIINQSQNDILILNARKEINIITDRILKDMDL